MTRSTTNPAASHQDTLATRLTRLAARNAGGSTADVAAATRAILSARARVLAKPRAEHDAAAQADRMDLLVFLIGSERLAMPLESIVAIIRAASVTPLPRAVSPVYGVTAWRGRPLTVLSIGAALAMPDAQRWLIVLGDGRRAIAGLLVDSVEETAVVGRSTLSPAQAGPRGAMAMGVTAAAILVLDAHALLHAARPEP